jgi:hypothetical protein
MPDGSEECGMILARLDAIDIQQREQAEDFRSLKAQLDRIEKKQARADGYDAGIEAAYAKLGKTVTLILAAIGATWAFFHWVVAEGGREWLRSLIFGP